MKFLIFLFTFSAWGQFSPNKSIAHCKIWEVQQCNLKVNACLQSVRMEDIVSANNCMDVHFDCAAKAKILCDEKFKE